MESALERVFSRAVALGKKLDARQSVVASATKRKFDVS